MIKIWRETDNWANGTGAGDEVADVLEVRSMYDGACCWIRLNAKAQRLTPRHLHGTLMMRHCIMNIFVLYNKDIRKASQTSCIYRGMIVKYLP